MAIYMKLSTIEGPVTTKGFEKTIELLSFNVSAHRPLIQPTRSEQNRGNAEATVEMATITKLWSGVDSTKLFQSIMKGDMNITATISFTNADSPPVTFLQAVLSNVAIARYSIRGNGNSEMPVEDIILSFTDIEWTPYTIGSDKKPVKGNMVKYTLPTGTVS